MLLGHSAGDGVQLRFRLFGRDTRLEPSDDKKIVAVARIEPGAARLDLFRHHQWHPEFRSVCDLSPDKTRWRNADDGEGMSVKQNFLSDDGGISGEALLPAGMAQDRDRVRGRSLIFFRQE